MRKEMFCRQCEQAAGGKGCEVMGNCGKDPTVSALLDLLLHGLQGFAVYADGARRLGERDPEADGFMLEALFTRVTNVNFDAEAIGRTVRRCYEMKDRMRGIYRDA